MTGFKLKVIAAVTMLIDHIGSIFYLGDTYRIVGRISFPIFAFLLTEGYKNTRSKKNYFLRVFLFGVVMQSIVILLSTFDIINTQIPLNIFLTLSTGIMMLMMIEYEESLWYKICIIFIFLIISDYVNLQYSWYGLLIIYLFYRINTRSIKMVVGFVLINIILLLYFNMLGRYYIANIQMYSLLALPFIILYNGKRGLKVKYFFYFFYPIHLVILYGIYMIIY